MAILGTFLALIFIAQARLTKQSVIVHKQAEALFAVNELLSIWALDWQALPTDDTGTLPAHEHLQWTTKLLETPELQEIGLQKIELTITDSSLALNEEPLFTMELALMLPPENPDAQEITESTENSQALKSLQNSDARTTAQNATHSDQSSKDVSL